MTLNNRPTGAISTGLNSKVKIDPNKAIQVDGGAITGTRSLDSEIVIFKGIPYAAPPVRELRWRAPQPLEAWSGVKECTLFGPSAVQEAQAPFMCWSKEFIIDTSLGYSEDCLTLNVWSKMESDISNRPVIVYIHGGGFGSGGSSCDVYDGEAIAKKDVVYVSINYRVAILGFLVHPELSQECIEGVSGNYGLLDQVAALEWVKKNISKFGGDPDNVTVVGQSAGSASVNALTMMPKAKGLFKNAVTMSFNYIDIKIDTMEKQELDAEALLKGKTLKDMRAMSISELLELSNQYRVSPCIDGKVIPDNQLDMLKAGTTNDVTLMTGMVTGDTALFSVLPKPPFTVPATMSKDDFITAVKSTFGDAAEECLVLYPVDGDEAIHQFNEINQDGMMALQVYLAKARALNSKNPTYIYKYTHVMPGENSAAFGAFHTADVPYFLNHFSSDRENYWTQADYTLGDKMSSYLVNFAKTGNPNGDSLEEWYAYDGNYSFQELGDKISTTTFSKEKQKLWGNYLNKVLGI